MRRREFIAGTMATVTTEFAQPLYAQVDGRVKRIAIFHPTEPPDGLTMNGRRAYKAYFGELGRLGYIEGQNLTIERYSALGQSGRFEVIAREIVASHPDLIVCVSGVLARLLKSITTIIPIVATSADPIAGGLVTNLARPDRNVTGVSADAGLEVNAKRLQLLEEAAGSPTYVHVLTPPSSRPLAEQTLAVLQQAARGTTVILKLAILDQKMDRDAFERVFDTMERNSVAGLIVSDAPEHLTNRQLIVDLAAKHHMPTIYPFREFVEVGGLMSYGVDAADMLRRLADVTGKILEGSKPGDIPFQQQTKFELMLNRITAKSLGLEFSANLMAVADEVVE
jgi:putative ABC transport system substrate-binding protein